MAAGLSFAIRAATLLPRTGVIGGKKALSSPLIWEALTKGAADAAAYGDTTVTYDDVFELVVDYNDQRLIGTAALSGGIFLASQMWFFNRLRMTERLLAAGELLARIRSESELALTLYNQGQPVRAAKKTRDVELLANWLEIVNDATPNPGEVAKLQAQLIEQSVGISDAIIDLSSDTVLASNRQLQKVAANLFDPGDLLGIRPITQEAKAAIGSLRVAQTTRAIQNLDDLLPKMKSIYSATLASQEIAGTTSALRVFSKSAGLAVGKILLVDTIIWAVTIGIDLGLNLFMTEEQQENLPLIGFLFKGAGWSPLGAALEWVIVNTAEFILGVDTVENIQDAFLSMLIAASQAPGMEELFELVLGFYIEEVDVNILAELSFGESEVNIAGLPIRPWRAIQDPLVILEAAVYVIVAKLVIRAWVLPTARYLHGAWKGAGN